VIHKHATPQTENGPRLPAGKDWGERYGSEAKLRVRVKNQKKQRSAATTSALGYARSSARGYEAAREAAGPRALQT
jgi:hypothetical protein